MDVYRPLRAALFFYECFRLLLLAAFLLAAPPEGPVFFPWLAYLSANALFPLAALFVWLRPAEYRGYLSLYIAGKIIAALSFCAAGFFARKESPDFDNMAKIALLWGGGLFINFTDILSVWGAWTLKHKLAEGTFPPGPRPPAPDNGAEFAPGETVVRFAGTEDSRQTSRNVLKNNGGI